MHVDAGNPPEFDAAAFDPFVGEWDPLPSRPVGCTVRYAANPGVSVPPLTWKACASGRSGCQKLVVDWPRTDGRDLSFPVAEPVRLVGGQPYIEYVKLWPTGLPSVGDFEAIMYAISPLTGSAAFAIGDVKESTGCGAEIGFGDYGIGVDAFTDKTTEMFGWARWSNPTNLTSVLLSMSGGTFATGISLSNSKMFLSLNPAGVDFINLANGDFVDRDTPTAFQGAQTYPTADGAFSTNGTGVTFLVNDASWNVVVQPNPQNVVTWVVLDRANSNRLIWVEAKPNGGTFTSPTLWTSPYATTPAGVSRQEVAAISDSNGLGLTWTVANAGAILSVTGPSSALLTRVSDGAGWIIAPEAGDAVGVPLWVDDNEVWFATGDASDPGYTADLKSITRIARSSLGSPTVSRGF